MSYLNQEALSLRVIKKTKKAPQPPGAPDGFRQNPSDFASGGWGLR